MWRFQFLLAALLLTAGCNGGSSDVPTGKLKGTIQFNATPLVAGVVLLEDDKRGIGASATVTNGEFQFEQPIPVGDYRIAVRPLPAPPPHEPPLPPEKVVKLPARYAEAETSGLTATVKTGENSIPIELSDTKTKK